MDLVISTWIATYKSHIISTFLLILQMHVIIFKFIAVSYLFDWCLMALSA